jgi:glucose dehydrogenase
MGFDTPSPLGAGLACLRVAVYAVKGRQFVVITATGGGKLGGETGDAYVAFALPAESAAPAPYYGSP